MMSTLIPIEKRSGKRCYCCGTNRSVKYMFPHRVSATETRYYNLCNRCVTRFDKEIEVPYRSETVMNDVQKYVANIFGDAMRCLMHLQENGNWPFAIPFDRVTLADFQEASHIYNDCDLRAKMRSPSNFDEWAAGFITCLANYHPPAYFACRCGIRPGDKL